jgi:catechol 2,3-dioxygenase-like lactoylglutathione lyase family enzyme
MLTKSMFYPTLPALDIERAQRFYSDTLGFDLIEGTEDPGDVFHRIGDQVLFVYYGGLVPTTRRYDERPRRSRVQSISAAISAPICSR